MIPAPSCIGKLPTHGDFLRIRVQQAQKLKFDQWFATRNKKAESDRQPASVTDPWCFVIQGQQLASSRHLFAIGVLFGSIDKIGRHYPFVMYQFVPKRWLINQLKQSDHWLKVLYDLSLIGRTKDSKQLDDMLKQFWAIYKPEWRDYFKSQTQQRITNNYQQAQQLLKHYQAQMIEPNTVDLEGVIHPPWLEWPHNITAHDAGGFWWKLDHKGRYLDLIQHSKLDKNLLDQLMA